MKRKFLLFLGLALLCMVLGCDEDGEGKDLNAKHGKFLSKYGWTIQSEVRSETIRLERMQPDLGNLFVTSNKAGFDLTPYIGKLVKETCYLAKEEVVGGYKVFLHVFEYNDEIIGGYGQVEEHLPGLFSIKEKYRFIEERLLE